MYLDNRIAYTKTACVATLFNEVIEVTDAVVVKKTPVWLARIAELATRKSNGKRKYTAEDVGTILGAWREDYQAKKKAEKAAMKAQQAAVATV